MRSLHKQQRKSKKSSDAGSVSRIQDVVVGREVLSVFSGFFRDAVNSVMTETIESNSNKIVPTNPDIVADNFNKNETKKKENERELNSCCSNNPRDMNELSNLTAMESKFISAEKSNDTEKEKLIFIPNKLENNDYFNWSSVQSAWKTNSTVEKSSEMQYSEPLNHDPGPSSSSYLALQSSVNIDLPYPGPSRAPKQRKRRKQAAKCRTRNNKSSVLANKKTVCQPDAKVNSCHQNSETEKKVIPVNITSSIKLLPELMNSESDSLKNYIVTTTNPVSKDKYMLRSNNKIDDTSNGESMICNQNLESAPQTNRVKSDEIPGAERQEDGLGVCTRNTRKRKASTSDVRSSMIDRVRTRKRKRKTKD